MTQQPPHGGRVAWGLDRVQPAPSTVTIGNFDGVHRGHLVLLRRAIETSRDHDVRAVAVTFDPHPAAVLRPGQEPPQLQTVEDRVDTLLAAGVDLVVVLPFTRELAALDPERFIDTVLVDRLAATYVVVGANFRFGHRAAGTVDTLRAAGRLSGFEVEAIDLQELDGVAISSTNVREHLAGGDVDWVTRALGRAFSVAGEVVPGDGRGRTIGVPTANVAVPDEVVLPADGVYAGHLHHGATAHPCVTNVGTRPTFGAGARTVEAHVLDAELDLYGANVRVSFEHRLRGEQRFPDVDALVARIRGDIDDARALLRG